MALGLLVRTEISRGRRNLAAARAMLKVGAEDFAVSHGYYAMYHLARAALLTKELKVKSHKEVVGGFGRDFVKTGRIVKEQGRALNEAMQDRLNAQYRLGETVEPEVAARVVREAEAFVAAVEAELNRGS